MRQQFQNQETAAEIVPRQRRQETEMPEATVESSRSQKEIQHAATLNQEARRLRKQVWRSAVYGGAGTVTLGVLLTVLIFRNHDDRALQPVFFLAALLLGMIGFVLASLRAGSRIRRRLLREIGDMVANGDVRAVGPLIDSLAIDEGSDHKQAVEGLTRLLPRLQPGDAALLDTTHRSTLCRYLNMNIEFNLKKDLSALSRPADTTREPNKRFLEFRVAILQAFASVGDKTTLPAVERLANRKAETPAEQLLQQAAEKWLPVLQARLAQSQDGETLLRASSLAESGSDTLLRAMTANAPEARAEQLLRATLSETPEK